MTSQTDNLFCKIGFFRVGGDFRKDTAFIYCDVQTAKQFNQTGLEPVFIGIYRFIGMVHKELTLILNPVQALKQIFGEIFTFPYTHGNELLNGFRSRFSGQVNHFLFRNLLFFHRKPWFWESQEILHGHLALFDAFNMLQFLKRLHIGRQEFLIHMYLTAASSLSGDERYLYRYLAPFQ